MKKKIPLTKPSKKICLRKTGNKYTLLFFAIVFPTFIIISSILYLLSMNGVPIHRLMDPKITTLIIGIFCIILGYVVSYWLFNMFYNPLEQMSTAAQKVAQGNYEVRLSYNGKDKELEAAIQNFNHMVQELNSVEIMRQDFIANVSHEFKTPLSSITGYVTLLQDPELTENERNEYIQMAFFNIEKLNDLTGNILQLSKLESQSTIQKPVTYRLDEQLREAIVLLEPKWSSKHMHLELEMPETYYCGQQALLFQVWTNLIGNAIKFTPDKGIISIQIQQLKQQIQVTIQDNGIGMSKETQTHIFEKFYQGDTSRKSQGNGLGLALCKRIIDLSGGEIQIESELGKGAVFTVIL